MRDILLSPKDESCFFVGPVESLTLRRSLCNHHHPLFPLESPLAQSKVDIFMSSPASGLMLRHTRFVTRRTALRHASTTAEAASNTAAKSKEAASNATSKASQGLSRVKSSAESGVSGAAQGVSNAAEKVQGRTSGLISAIQCESIQVYGSRQITPSQLSP